ncbi:MAG: LPS export ABC transporter permease LptF [Hyphomicrobiaceae bacterium]|nr:LPS export ABC transporter permease LptF [Hyphomicrobiaceae bacterium]
MKLLERYIFRQVASALSLILMSLGGIIWIALALKQLDVVTSQGQDALTLLKMTTLALPNLLAIIAPFALLIATLHTLNRLGGDSELIVITAAGGNVWRIARPFVALALIVAVAIAVVNHLAQPWSLQQLKAYIIQARTDLLQQVIQPGRFSSPEPNLTFHIRERSPTGELRGLLIHDARKAPERQSYLAEKGIILNQDDVAYLIMSDGHILRSSNPNQPPQIIVFDRYVVNLDSFDKKTTDTLMLKPRERYFFDLLRPKEPPETLIHIKGQLRSELHERLSNPLYPIAFVMIALAFAGNVQSTRQNRAERLVLGFVVAAAVRISGFALNNLATLKAGYVPFLYLLPGLVIVFAAIMIVRGMRPRTTYSFADTVIERIEPIRRRLLPSTGRALAGPSTGDR